MDLPLSLKEGLSAIKRVPGYDGDDASAFVPTESSLWSCHEAMSMPVGFLKGPPFGVSAGTSSFLV